jgi:hypothetical protein
MHRNFLVTVLALSFLYAAGCNRDKANIENSIREGMKSQLNIEITSIDISKQSDGTYSGTATASNGDVYEITTEPPKDNQVMWKATPSQSVVERRVSETLESELKIKVKKLTLTKKGSGEYEGKAELESGAKLKVTVGMEQNQPMIKWAPLFE